MIVYHGSPQLVSVPIYGAGKVHNDYGPGFYCTQNLEMAKEWACPESSDGFANQYRLDTDGLSCLNLNQKPCHILNWLAILLENRVFDVSYPIMSQGKRYLHETFLPAYKDYDLITGYRADDSYFSFAKDFLLNIITLEQLSKAMRLGRLGTQVVIKSERAFNSIWKEMSYVASGNIYHPRRVTRDRKAREDYMSILSENPLPDGIHMYDIIKEKWQNDDPRIP